MVGETERLKTRSLTKRAVVLKYNQSDGPLVYVRTQLRHHRRGRQACGPAYRESHIAVKTVPERHTYNQPHARVKRCSKQLQQIVC
eukprot:15388-Eustigmatos_ZCMA.PRE.1